MIFEEAFIRIGNRPRLLSSLLGTLDLPKNTRQPDTSTNLLEKVELFAGKGGAFETQLSDSQYSLGDQRLVKEFLPARIFLPVCQDPSYIGAPRAANFPSPMGLVEELVDGGKERNTEVLQKLLDFLIQTLKFQLLSLFMREVKSKLVKVTPWKIKQLAWKPYLLGFKMLGVLSALYHFQGSLSEITRHVLF